MIKIGGMAVEREEGRRANGIAKSRLHPAFFH
jgi:hypothetical protein